MTEVCETVVVLANNELGCMTINKSDFDANVHHLVGGEADKTMTKAELQEDLAEKGVDFKPAMTKAELQVMLDAS